jgi:16S rRNA processing protein RimM
LKELKSPELKLIPLARIKRAHGVHGSVVAEVYNPQNPLGLLTQPRVFLLGPDGPPKPVTLTGRPANQDLILKITYVTTRNQAEDLKGLELAVDRADLPSLEEDEFYQDDLLDMTAVLDTGETLGQVVSLLPAADNLVLVIRDDGGWENLIPFSDDWVPEVNLAQRTVTIAPGPGLLTPKPPAPLP